MANPALGHSEVGKAGAFMADFGPTHLASGLMGFVFAASGPLAIVLSVGTTAGLSTDELASSMFGIFFINGLITIGMSWV